MKKTDEVLADQIRQKHQDLQVVEYDHPGTELGHGVMVFGKVYSGVHRHTLADVKFVERHVAIKYLGDSRPDFESVFKTVREAVAPLPLVEIV